MGELRRWARLLILLGAALPCGCTSSTAGKPIDGASCQDLAGPIPGTPLATFDGDIGQFVFDVGPSDGNVMNLGVPDAGSAPPPTLSYDGAEGSPSPGALQVTAPFSGANQYLGAYHFFGCGAAQDWTGKNLHARIKVATGSFTGDALVYVATSTTCARYDFAGGAYTLLVHPSCWQDLNINIGDPASKTAGYDPTSVVDFGVQFFTGSDGANAGPVTFLLDSFSVE